MSPENQQITTKICPTCGTRLGINATRCSVCGSTLSTSVAVSSSKAVTGPRMPAVTLSLPLLFGIAVLLLVIGAGVVFAVMRGMPGQTPVEGAVAPTSESSPTVTGTATLTPTMTLTVTPLPTWTLPPPVEYTVADGDTCGPIAFAFGVSIQSIIVQNNLDTNCTLSVGQKLQIPQPTPTASPEPTRTLNPTEMVQAECNTMEYTVKAGESMNGIAANYAVSMASIIQYNGLSSEMLLEGQKIIIPLCEQMLETPTSTPVPPYAAPNLLLPADGASYTNPSEVITVQWSSVGTLRQNEAYAVTIEDVTEGEARKLVEYVTDQKFIVPQSFRPVSSSPHVFRWSVLPVRQTGTDNSGNPVWEPAGAASVQRVFSWMGTGSPPPTNTPEP